MPAIHIVRKLYYIPGIRKLYHFPVDATDSLLGRRTELTPPRSKIFVGCGDFQAIGEEFLRYFAELGALKPNEKVLDVGCGIGRMAVPLTRYLKDGGSYEGFDIVTDGINWCRKKITPNYPHFHFQLSDIYNKLFNPKGRYKASEYNFPYDKESFDFIFLISVFTHMLPQDMENYFSQIGRVLKRGGRCLITFFLLNKESLKLIDAGLSRLDFKHEFNEYRTIDQDTPEYDIAYNEEFIRRRFNSYGLNIVEPIHYGSWCGRRSFLSDQDIIIAIKK